MKYKNIREEDKNKVGLTGLSNLTQPKFTEILTLLFFRNKTVYLNEPHFYGQKLKLVILTFLVCLYNLF